MIALCIFGILAGCGFEYLAILAAIDIDGTNGAVGFILISLIGVPLIIVGIKGLVDEIKYGHTSYSELKKLRADELSSHPTIIIIKTELGHYIEKCSKMER